MFIRTWLAALIIALGSSMAAAQNLCPLGVESDKLICLIPQVYGVNGLVLANNFSTFQNILPDSLRPLNSAVAKQSALLPLASSSSGLIFTWDPAAKIPVPSTDSFGPIFGERADTIGKYQVFLGFDYQYFRFDTLDGVDLKHLPVVFTQPDFTLPTTPPQVCSLNGTSTGPCGIVRDVVKTDNRLDLKIHQFTTFLTFGLTNRIDLSLAIPIEDVRMAISSTSTIIDNSLSKTHSFPFQPNCGSIFPVVVLCTHTVFARIRSASGIGDMVLRVKGTIWKGERAALALGADVRVPTGDALNFLGAGAAGVKPFVVWSYRARISPHVFVGYETNGSSVIAGDISTGSKERLPGQLLYSGGADVWLSKRVTAAFDLLGQQVFQARRTSVTTFLEPEACLDPSCATGLKPAGNKDQSLSQLTGTFNVTSASVGVKFRPFSNLLITGNVLVKLNDGGLRATAAPLYGISYTF